MNDRTEKCFTQWLIDIEKEKLEGEKELANWKPRIKFYETDEPDPEEDCAILKALKASEKADRSRFEGAVKARAKRESDLMLLGYNQAILDYGQLPDGWETQDMIRTISEQKAKLGIE